MITDTVTPQDGSHVGSFNLDSGAAKMATLLVSAEVAAAPKEITVIKNFYVDRTIPGSFVTVAAAEEYVARLRAQTTDPAVTRNAVRTLAALQRLR